MQPFVAPGYEPVGERFAASFGEAGEVGGAFCAVRDGETVVDVWGGSADPHRARPWREDTLQLIYSGTKGLTAACVLMLVERGQLALEEPVARHWPEFAAAGKGAIRLQDVLAHRAGLPGLRRTVGAAECADPEATAVAIAAEPPVAALLGRACYHPLTFGWILGELVRRVDGRTIGRFFAEEVAGPLGLDCWIGLPDAQHGRVSRLVFDGPPLPERVEPGDPLAAVRRTVRPRVLAEEREWLNTPAGWRAEIAAGGGVATARSMARFYGCLAAGGALDGVRILAPETVALASQPLVRATDALSGEPIAYGAGFALLDRRDDLPRVEGAFGHGGFGGSQHLAWPAQRIGVSFAPNLIRQLPAGRDATGPRLLDALAGCVGAL